MKRSSTSSATAPPRPSPGSPPRPGGTAFPGDDFLGEESIPTLTDDTFGLVQGPREESQNEAIRQADGSAFYASHKWQAFFLQGTKTLAYEIWEDLGFRAR